MFSINIYVYWLKITGIDNGCCFSNEPRIETIDEIPEGEIFDYLRLEGAVTYTIDRTYNIPINEIQFNGWLESSVRLWLKDNRAGSNFFLLERTPSSSPSISSLSDRGFSTVF